MPRTKTVSDDAVLESTGRVLVRLGPHRFTLAEVGREAGLSPATLLQRFGSKRGLLRAFAHRGASTVRTFFDSRPARRSHVSSLRRSLASMASSLADRRTLPNSLAMLVEDLRDPVLRRAAGVQAKAVERAIRERLRAAIDHGEIPEQDEAALARLLHAAWNGAVITWALHGTGTLEAWIDRVLDPLLR
jgi:AcrR family transcriptional regulator